MRYRADPDSPFRLYDCLVPCMKHHLKVPIAFQKNINWQRDISMHMNYNRDKLELRQGENADIKYQNLILKARVARLTEELKCI